MTEIAASIETILEARETIKRFQQQGGSCFIDGCSGLSDNDIIIIAKHMNSLMNPDTTEDPLPVEDKL